MSEAGVRSRLDEPREIEDDSDEGRLATASANPVDDESEGGRSESEAITSGTKHVCFLCLVSSGSLTDNIGS